ncbi:hypothetical protein [Endozoicomonas sp. ALD068]|uniref:hypothetical protein n=1 Tax=Endozoicomonas sp. ALD068 TaxID=3403080 RepID=UPI003BB530DE
MSPPPKFKDSPVEFDQHLLFPTNVFDLLPKDHDCFIYESIFQNINTSEVEKNITTLVSTHTLQSSLSLF